MGGGGGCLLHCLAWAEGKAEENTSTALPLLCGIPANIFADSLQCWITARLQERRISHCLEHCPALTRWISMLRSKGELNAALSSLSVGWALCSCYRAAVCWLSLCQVSSGWVSLLGAASWAELSRIGAGVGSACRGCGSSALLAGWCPVRRTWKCCALHLTKFPGSRSLIFQERVQSKPSNDLVSCSS